MFKNGVFFPLVLAKDEKGNWGIQERQRTVDDEDDGEAEEVALNLDDPFYMEAFRALVETRQPLLLCFFSFLGGGGRRGGENNVFCYIYIYIYILFSGGGVFRGVVLLEAP